MLNPFIIKKYGALVVASMMSVVLFYVGTIYYGILWGIGFLLIGLIMGMLVGVFLLKNPFQDMMEGKGILTINLDSTGLLRPFISSMVAPYIRARLDGKDIDDIFNRATVYNLAGPQKAGKGGFTDLTRKVLKDKKKKKEFDEAFKTGDWSKLKEGTDYVIKTEKYFALLLTEKEYNAGRFALFHYPTLLWNNQANTLITKDLLSDIEKDIYSEHPILYLNKKIQELTSAVRDFGRHVVENLKPKEGLMSNWWVWIIIIIFGVIMVVLFLPAIMDTIGSVAGPGAKAVSKATGSAIRPL